MSDAHPLYGPLVVVAGIGMVAAGVLLVIAMLRTTVGPFAFFEDLGLERADCVALVGKEDRGELARRIARHARLERVGAAAAAASSECDVLVVDGVALSEAELDRLDRRARQGASVGLFELAGAAPPADAGSLWHATRESRGAGRLGRLVPPRAETEADLAVRASRDEARRSLLAWLLRMPHVVVAGDAVPGLVATLEPQGPRRFLLRVSNRSGRATREIALRVELHRDVERAEVARTTLSLPGAEPPRIVRHDRRAQALDLVVPALGPDGHGSYTLDLTAASRRAATDPSRRPAG